MGVDFAQFGNTEHAKGKWFVATSSFRNGDF